MVTGARTLFDIYTNKCSPLPEWDESVRFHDLRHTFSTLAIQSGVDAKTVAGMLGHYSAAFTLDTYTHVTEQMKRGAAEKIGVFMNASVNVQVNVVHSPSAVVRGDYESDLANWPKPVEFDGFRSNITVDIEQGKRDSEISNFRVPFFVAVCRQKRYHSQSLAPQWFCGFAVLCAREIPTVKPHPLYDLQAHTFS